MGIIFQKITILSKLAFLFQLRQWKLAAPLIMSVHLLKRVKTGHVLTHATQDLIAALRLLAYPKTTNQSAPAHQAQLETQPLNASLVSILVKSGFL